MSRLALIIEFLAQPRGQFLSDFSGIDLRTETSLDFQEKAELTEIGLDRGAHVGILELDRERPGVGLSSSGQIAVPTDAADGVVPGLAVARQEDAPRIDVEVHQEADQTPRNVPVDAVEVEV